MVDDHHQVTLNSMDEARTDLSSVTNLEEVDWTFEGWNTQEFTHGLHPYPARMVPQIVRALLHYYLNTDVISADSRVYDPFSGSGTTAVEARLAGLDSVANDVNPLACELSRAKALPLDTDALDTLHNELLDGLAVELKDIREGYAADADLEIDEPEVRDGWFPLPQLYELCAIRDRITELEAEHADVPGVTDITRFFRVALSRTTRRVSYQRNGEYKRYRLAEEDREDHDPDVFSLFKREMAENVEMMKEYSRAVSHDCETAIYNADSRQADHLNDNSADIVVTSPPYGDHQTTVAYGQFSQDPAIVSWGRGYDEMKQVDKDGLGGANEVLEPLSTLEEWSPMLQETLNTLREKDGRADDALNFFTDYYAVMEDVARVVKPGQPVAWVVANRTMSRVNIPTHIITRELCEHLGYTHEDTLPREIPTKTLPWENAPENMPGVKGELMANENIVIMRSPDSPE